MIELQKGGDPQGKFNHIPDAFQNVIDVKAIIIHKGTASSKTRWRR